MIELCFVSLSQKLEDEHVISPIMELLIGKLRQIKNARTRVKHNTMKQDSGILRSHL